MTKELKKIILKSKKQVYGDKVGNNASMFQGEGFEFTELREYVYGDDIRKIDWNTTAKLQKPFVKIYKEERELNVVVVSILSGSMGFGTVALKSTILNEVVATIGFSAIKNSDLFSHFIFTDDVKRTIKPSKKLFSIYKAMQEIEEFEAIGEKVDFNALVEFLNFRLRKKALLFIVSDFVGDINFNLLAKKHDIFAVIIRDKFEEEPQELGYLKLIDMQTKNSFEGDINNSRLNNYKKALYLNDEKLYKNFKKQGIRFTKIYTHQNPSLKLLKAMR